MSRLNSTVLLLSALSGCATTGQAWVQQPEDARAAVTSSELERITVADRATLASVRTTEPSFTEQSDPPRHRLDHVVSLGEAAPSGAAPGVSGGVASGPAPVVVNIVNYAAPSYGAGYCSQPYPVSAHRAPIAGGTRLAPVSAAPSGTPALGNDWQAPKSYGPNFPYRTGPASPWERAR